MESKNIDDGGTVSLEREDEIQHWCKAFGCTEGELRAAVTKVGDSVPRLREYLALPANLRP
jgi:hypothetical protein